MDPIAAFRPRPVLLLVSGPAGSGKTTLCDRMTAAYPEALRRIVTCTTRPPRGPEKNGVDYHFLSREEFEDQVRAGEFLEHARVHQNLYGTRKREVLTQLAEGRDLLLNLDVQGAGLVRETASGDPLLRRALVTLFILPPDREELRSRLAGRGTDSAEEIERRMRVAELEMARFTEYDHCLRSSDRETDFNRIRAVYEACKMRV